MKIMLWHKVSPLLFVYVYIHIFWYAIWLWFLLFLSFVILFSFARSLCLSVCVFSLSLSLTLFCSIWFYSVRYLCVATCGLSHRATFQMGNDDDARAKKNLNAQSRTDTIKCDKKALAHTKIRPRHRK